MFELSKCHELCAVDGICLAPFQLVASIG